MAKSREKKPAPLNVWSSLAVVFPLGLAPKAPGTFGSLAGLPVGFLFFNLSDSWATRLALLVLLGLFSWLVIDRTEKFWNTHDDGRIVIDEVLGQAIPLTFFNGDWKIYLIAFVLFRFFDIVKPGPVGWADRKLPGAWGTLLDDVIAGIFAWWVMILGDALLVFFH